ncbi:hypothetical protein JCM11641_000899 [Rhodosporidiobolus odoratus]
MSSPPAFPKAPDPACPVEYLPMLLPKGLVREVWLPFLRCRKFRPSTPTVDIAMLEWNLELESHYQKFHPNTWRILEVDEMDDWKYRYALVRMVSTPSHPVPWADAFKDDLETRAVWTQRFDDVADRILLRAAAFYALHEARCVYFEHQRKSGKTDAEIIRTLPAGRPENWSTMRNSSLWPLPACPPPVPGLTIVTRANAQQYRLPPAPLPISSPTLQSLDDSAATEDATKASAEQNSDGKVATPLVAAPCTPPPSPLIGSKEMSASGVVRHRAIRACTKPA